MINGQTYDWESVSATIAGKILDGIKEISYDEEQELEAVYGRGNKPIAYGKGKYKASGKMTLLKPEFDMFEKVSLPAGGLAMVKPFPITVTYRNDDQSLKTDVLKDCLVKKIGRAAKQGDKELTVSVEFEILGGVASA